MLHITFNAWFTLAWAITYLLASYYTNTIGYEAVAQLFKNVTVILVLTVLVCMLLVGGQLKFNTIVSTPIISFEAIKDQ